MLALFCVWKFHNVKPLVLDNSVEIRAGKKWEKYTGPEPEFLCF